MPTAEQKSKLSALFSREHVAVLITQGAHWATGTIQAFAETPDLDLLFIVGADSEKFQNALQRPNVTVVIDTRDHGKVETFEIVRSSIQGVAREVPRDSAEWESMKAIFLAKNPFESPFFGNPTLRMLRIAPTRISYANGLKDAFKAEF